MYLCLFDRSVYGHYPCLRLELLSIFVTVSVSVCLPVSMSGCISVLSWLPVHLWQNLSSLSVLVHVLAPVVVYLF